MLTTARLPEGVFLSATLIQLRPWFWTYLLFGWRLGWFEWYYLNHYEFRHPQTKAKKVVSAYVLNGEPAETPEKIRIAEQAAHNEPIFAELTA